MSNIAPFYKVNYFVTWGKTSWTDSMHIISKVVCPSICLYMCMRLNIYFIFLKAYLKFIQYISYIEAVGLGFPASHFTAAQLFL